MRSIFTSLFAKKKPVPRKKSEERPSEHYDLKEIYNEINHTYFESKLDLPIGWFGSKSRIPKTQVRLGYYNQKTQVVKINRLLDQAHIPKYFISFIVYHEMLHHVLPPIKQRRRRKIHHQAFTQQEKQFQEYAEAKAFLLDLKNTLFKR